MDKDNPRPDEENIYLTINKKIADANFSTSESRLRFALWFGLALITIFGIALPLLLTQRSSQEVDRAVQRVDTAIEKMEEGFAELAGEQLRKPDIECYLDGEKLEGSVMHIEGGKREGKKVQITNTGNKETSAIQMILYTKEEVYCPTGYDFDREEISDEIENGFKFALRADPLTKKYGGYIKLQAGDSKLRKFPPTCGSIPTLETEALLKVYYGQPEPKRFRFTIKSSLKERK